MANPPPGPKPTSAHTDAPDNKPCSDQHKHRRRESRMTIDNTPGRTGEVIFTGDPTTSGVRHDNCDHLAQVTPHLDAAYCAKCRWQCRISGAWYLGMLADVAETLSRTTIEAT